MTRRGEWLELPLTVSSVQPLSAVVNAKPTDRLRCFSVCIGHSPHEGPDIGSVTEWPVLSVGDRAEDDPSPKPIWTAQIGPDRLEGFFETRKQAVEAVITRAAMAGGAP